MQLDRVGEAGTVVVAVGAATASYRKWGCRRNGESGPIKLLPAVVEARSMAQRVHRKILVGRPRPPFIRMTGVGPKADPEERLA
jgi:hypothetical protein